MARRKQFWLRIAGWFFIVLGVLGLVLPFLQGVLFLLIGLYLLSLVDGRARLARQRLRRRYPAIGRGLDEAETWVKRRRRRWRPTTDSAS